MEEKFLTADEKIEALEADLGKYEEWNDETAARISESEELTKLFDIGVCGKLLDRTNEIFMPIIFDTYIGDRCHLAYKLMSDLYKEESVEKLKEVISHIREKKDPIINLVCDMVMMEVDSIDRTEDEIKDDIMSLKKYFFCISTSNIVETLLYQLISQYEELYFEYFEKNIVEEVKLDEYDMKVKIFNETRMQLINKLDDGLKNMNQD